MIIKRKCNLTMSLDIKNLKLGYEEKIIINDITISIPKGKITMLIGANGCGKSTLLHGMSRLLKLCYFGRNPYKTIFGSRTVEDDDMVDWAIEATGMKEFEGRMLDSLSGGQRQRAWIAMALTQGTDILLLDEPTTYLDLSHQIEVLELLKELNRKFGKTIVIVHHELNQAAKYGDNLICMKSGQVYSTGTVDNVFNEKMLKEVFGVNAIIIDDPISNRPMCIPM